MTRTAHDPGGKWEIIGPLECPVFYRWTLYSGRAGKLLVHRFQPDASDKDCHDHPRPFVTLVLRGGYDDISPCYTCCDSEVKGWILGEPSDDWRRAQPMELCPTCQGAGRLVDTLRAPTWRYRPAEHAHITKAHPDGALTVCLMLGPVRRAWGFLRDGAWYRWPDYERIFGLNWRCDE